MALLPLLKHNACKLALPYRSGGIEDMQEGWLEMCRTAAIDPQEVRLIHERYAAYRGFTEKNTGSSIPLEQWFGFYHLEKSSEGVQASAPVEGCSADGDAVNNACLKRPAEFLTVLLVYQDSLAEELPE